MKYMVISRNANLIIFKLKFKLLRSASDILYAGKIDNY